MRERFPRLGDTNVEEDIFVRPKIFQLVKIPECDLALDRKEKEP